MTPKQLIDLLFSSLFLAISTFSFAADLKPQILGFEDKVTLQDEIEKLLLMIRFDKKASVPIVKEFLERNGFGVQLEESSILNIVGVPVDSLVSQSLTTVLQEGGFVKIDFVTQSLASRSEIGGIFLDPSRFLLSLADNLNVIPHEVLHFVHFQELSRGEFKPYHSYIVHDDADFLTYKNSFVIDEINTFKQDAEIGKNRGYPILRESSLDWQGKCSLAFMMAAKVKKLAEMILANIAADKIYIEKMVQTAPHPFPRDDRKVIAFPADAKSYLIATVASTFVLTPETAIDLIQGHLAFANQSLAEITANFEVESDEDARKIVLTERAALVE